MTCVARPIKIEHQRIAAFAPPSSAVSARRLGSLAASAPPAVIAAQRLADAARRVNSIQRFPIVQMLVDLDAEAKRQRSRGRGYSDVGGRRRRRKRQRPAKDVVLASSREEQKDASDREYHSVSSDSTVSLVASDPDLGKPLELAGGKALTSALARAGTDM